MATEILRPNAAGDYTNWEYQYPASGDYWDKIDEVTPDNYSTHISTASKSIIKEAFGLQNTSISGEVFINNVRLYYCCHGHATPYQAFAYFRPALRLSGVEENGDWECFEEVWETRNQIVARPSGGSWQLADLNDLQIVMSAYCSYFTDSCNMTQFYAEVDYDIVGHRLYPKVITSQNRKISSITSQYRKLRTISSGG